MPEYYESRYTSTKLPLYFPEVLVPTQTKPTNPIFIFVFLAGHTGDVGELRSQQRRGLGRRRLSRHRFRDWIHVASRWFGVGQRLSGGVQFIHYHYLTYTIAILDSILYLNFYFASMFCSHDGP